MKISIFVTDATLAENLIYEEICKPLIGGILEEFLGLEIADSEESEVNE